VFNSAMYCSRSVLHNRIAFWAVLFESRVVLGQEGFASETPELLTRYRFFPPQAEVPLLIFVTWSLRT
jgi:hypothetical protein